MGKNITIKEDGTTKTFSGVMHIMTPAISGGDVEWVPTDNISKEILKITKNGTYTPSGDIAGWRVVYIDVSPTQVKGKDKVDGKTYIYKVDEFGNLLKIPVI